MAQVTVEVNKRLYEIACDDGQEAHLHRLSEYVNKRISELVAAVGQIGDARLLLMASLLLADELSDAYDEVRGLRTDTPAQQAASRAGTSGDENLDAEDLAQSIDAMAEHIEAIAERLAAL